MLEKVKCLHSYLSLLSCDSMNFQVGKKIDRILLLCLQQKYYKQINLFLMKGFRVTFQNI